MLGWFAAGLGRILVSIFVPVHHFYRAMAGFSFSCAIHKPLKLCWCWWRSFGGWVGWRLLFTVSNWLVEQLPDDWTRRLQPFVFVGPALAILAWFLAIPTLRTLYVSFMDANSFNFVGLANYIYAFTDRIMLEAFRNNLLWLIFGTSFSVGLGLLIAVLADRSRFENRSIRRLFSCRWRFPSLAPA